MLAPRPVAFALATTPKIPLKFVNADPAIPTSSECTKSDYQLDARRTDTIATGVYCDGITVETGARLKLDPGTCILDRGNFEVNVSGTRRL